jgi:hypothetical protein
MRYSPSCLPALALCNFGNPARVAIFVSKLHYWRFPLPKRHSPKRSIDNAWAEALSIGPFTPSSSTRIFPGVIDVF